MCSHVKGDIARKVQLSDRAGKEKAEVAIGDGG